MFYMNTIANRKWKNQVRFLFGINDRITPNNIMNPPVNCYHMRQTILKETENRPAEKIRNKPPAFVGNWRKA
jgi:hypothetical protein